VVDRSLEIVSMKDPTTFGLDAAVLSVGDKIVEVGGEAATDQVDFHYHASLGKAVRLKVERAHGAVEEVVLPAEALEGLQIWFKAMDFRRCRCKCPFCFVDQMPTGMRESLYVKDEDFRLSFLYGNFTTMNDITDEELDKIIRQNNSPQWVSVHVIDEGMRRFIFGRPMKRNIVETLRRLAEGGIRIHTQAVLVPGKNDGEYLSETIEVLEGLHPNVVSMAVVPVGLTKHRQGLPGIRSYEPEEMGDVLDAVVPFQQRFLSGARTSRFVFPSDEWFVGSGRDVPAEEAYEGFPQLDNGVGMIRQWLGEIDADIEALGIPADLGAVVVITGVLGARVFERYVLPLLAACGVASLPEVLEVPNEFFGRTVTCSGLLVGGDIAAALGGKSVGGKVVMIPPNCLNHESVTIDGMSTEDLAAAIGTTVVDPGDSFVEALHECAGGSGAHR
jgi:putative radical SAM enzyme (TIGR03279 family)